MIDVLERTIFRNELARLVAGESTNVEFEDACSAHGWHDSQDRGIRAIAEFGCDLCDFEFAFGGARLAGKYAVTGETRKVAERCDLFLQSCKEYEWPDRPADQGEGCLAGMAIFLGLPFAIAMGLVALMMAAQRDWVATLPAGILAMITLIVSGAAIWGWSKISRRDQLVFEESGDYDVWPFLRQDEFNSIAEMVIEE